MQTIVKENFMNSGLSDATGNVPAVAENRASNPTISPRLGVALSDEKLDSGICSECSQGRRRKHVMRSRDDKTRRSRDGMFAHGRGIVRVCVWARDDGGGTAPVGSCLACVAHATSVHVYTSCRVWHDSSFVFWSLLGQMQIEHKDYRLVGSKLEEFLLDYLYTG